jgi:hypothetical protein
LTDAGVARGGRQVAGGCGRSAEQSGRSAEQGGTRTSKPVDREAAGRRTLAATEYSSTRGSRVRWIWRGSSVDRETERPRAKYIGKGDFW